MVNGIVQTVVKNNIILNIFRVRLYRTAGRAVTGSAAENAAVLITGFARTAAENTAVAVTSNAGTAAENAAVTVFFGFAVFVNRVVKQFLPGRHAIFFRARAQRIGHRAHFLQIAVGDSRLNTSAGFAGYDRLYLGTGAVFSASHLSGTSAVVNRRGLLRTIVAARSRTLSGGRESPYCQCSGTKSNFQGH